MAGTRSCLHEVLDLGVERLAEAMKLSRDSGDIFRRRWRALRPRDQATIDASWQNERWLDDVLVSCPELIDRMADTRWLEAREPLSRSEQAGRARKANDPEAKDDKHDPLDIEQSEESAIPSGGQKSQQNEVVAWVRRLRQETLGEMIAPYFRADVIRAATANPRATSRAANRKLKFHRQYWILQADRARQALTVTRFREDQMAE